MIRGHFDPVLTAQAVAEDYFAAMGRVEQRLEIGPLSQQEQEVEDEDGAEPERAQLLFWVERLALPELCQEERLEIVAQLKQAFSLDQTDERPPPKAVA